MNECNLTNLVTEKISEGDNLINLLEKKWIHIEGVQKLQRKIQQELNFLKKIYRNQNIKAEHLQCSNLTHFGALVDVMGRVDKCLNVSKVFVINEKRLTIDIVCDGGLTWIKVIARNPRSLNQICMGDASYGVRSILDQAQEFLDCAKLYPCLFQTPKVVFSFANGVGSTLANRLENLGVIVKGTKLDDDELEIETDDDEGITMKPIVDQLSSKNAEHLMKLNLDVSAMLAYVSNMTNGSANFIFKVPVLTQQAAWERETPVKPILDALFNGKTLYCCQTAKTNFDNIISTVGGPSECFRANEFVKRIQVLPDNATVSDITTSGGTKEYESEAFNSIQYSNKILTVGGKIKERSLIIFTFGDGIQAVTVTANDGFVRAAKQKGVNFVVFVHGSRALSEQKESKATVIEKMISQ